MDIILLEIGPTVTASDPNGIFVESFMGTRSMNVHVRAASLPLHTTQQMDPVVITKPMMLDAPK